MKGIVKKNFETGKLLLVATLLLSLNLVLQLFAVADTLDLSNGLELSGLGLTLTASYILTAVSMIIVLQEFFQVKTKIKGLIELNSVLNRTDESVQDKEVNAITSLVSSDVPTVINMADEVFDDIELDENEEFEKLLDDELDDDLENEEENKSVQEPGLDPVTLDLALGKYKTRKLKFNEETGEMEPVIDDGALQDLLDQAAIESDESEQLAKLMEDSEVIKTLHELEDIVEELKNKKSGTVDESPVQEPSAPVP
jgi:hypothetical protein